MLASYVLAGIAVVCFLALIAAIWSLWTLKADLNRVNRELKKLQIKPKVDNVGINFGTSTGPSSYSPLRTSNPGVFSSNWPNLAVTGTTKLDLPINPTILFSIPIKEDSDEPPRSNQ